MKIAKVITTSFVPRQVREKTALCGTPMGYFSHSQNFPTNESIIDLINFTIEIEQQCNPGESVDLILVNNDSGWRDGVRFLDGIDNKRLRHGKIRVLHRKNFGRSFGGYNHAFQTFSSLYDYYIFTEDDIVIGRDGYASIAIDVFKKTANCGFVAYQCVTTTALDYPPEDALAAHGGVGLTSTDVLNHVVKSHGCLPHADEYSPQAHVDIIRLGEIPFTNKIYKLGYKLASVPDEIKLYDFAYDLMRGLNIKKFPSLSEKVINLTKRKAYNYKAVRLIHKFCRTMIGQLNLK